MNASQIRTSNSEGIAFVILTIIGFVYVVLRAMWVPIMCDEATSFLAYAQPGTFLPFRSAWDANNHFLSSACGALGYSIAGLQLMALRWASVASYPLFAYALWRMGWRVASTEVRWCFWLALLFCPLLIEYFSLFRGYAPALAFLLVALNAIIEYADDREDRKLWIALLCIAVSNGFMLAFVPLWAVALALLLFMAWRDQRHRSIVLLIGIVPLALAVAYSLILARYGMLYHGRTDNFVDATFGSLALAVFGTGNTLLVQLMFVITLASALWLVWRNVQARTLNTPAMMVASLLLVEGVGRIVAAKAIGLNYAEDRTAMHVLLLGVIVITFAVDELQKHGRWTWVFGVLLLALPVRTISMANVEAMVQLPETSIPGHFVEQVEQWELANGRPAVVGTVFYATFPWALQRRMHGSEGDANAADPACDFLLLPRSGITGDLPGFAVADSAPANKIVLLERRPALRTTVVLDTMISVYPLTGVADAMFELPLEALRANDLQVQVSGAIGSATEPLFPRLSIQVLGVDGDVLQANETHLNTRREAWHGERFTTIRLLPHQPDAAKSVMFFHEANGQAMSVEEVRLIVRFIEQ